MLFTAVVAAVVAVEATSHPTIRMVLSRARTSTATSPIARLPTAQAVIISPRDSLMVRIPALRVPLALVLIKVDVGDVVVTSGATSVDAVASPEVLISWRLLS